MRRFTTTVACGLAITACGGSSTPNPSTPSPAITRTPTQQPATIINVTLTPTGTAGAVGSTQCRAGMPCSFVVTVTASETVPRPLRVTIVPGDGTEALVFEAVDAVTTKTWSHVYAAGHYTSILTITQGASAATVVDMRVGIFVG